MDSLIRLIVDTNVFVSGIINKNGYPGRILQAVRSGIVELITSDAMIDELLRVLNYPRIRKYSHVNDELIRSVAALLLYQTERVEPKIHIELSKDPYDNCFLEAAVTGKVNALITGDRSHLLVIEKIHGIPIITARQCVNRFNL